MSKDADALGRICWQIVVGPLMTKDDVLFSLLSGLIQRRISEWVWAFAGFIVTEIVRKTPSPWFNSIAWW